MTLTGRLIVSDLHTQVVRQGVVQMFAPPRMPAEAEERVGAIAAEVIERLRQQNPEGDIDAELIRMVGLCMS